MGHDVTISSIDFNADSSYALSYAKVNYSNGESSPAYGLEDYEHHYYPETVTFDETPIRSVLGTTTDELEYEGQDYFFVTTPIKFKDSEGTTITSSSYTPVYQGEVTWTTKNEPVFYDATYDIGANEQIIGVYGKNSDLVINTRGTGYMDVSYESYFSSFGFIVKVLDC